MQARTEIRPRVGDDREAPRAGPHGGRSTGSRLRRWTLDRWGSGKEALSSKAGREALILIVLSLAAAVLFYLPFWLHAPSIAGVPFAHEGIDRVYGMWDGPLYVTVAASLYDPNPHNPVYVWLSSRPIDLTERFPLYPLLIRGLSPAFGYWRSELGINVVVSTVNTVFLYAFVRRFGSLRDAASRGPSAAFWVALIAIFWPPRSFLYRYVGMPEPLFVMGVLGAAYYYKRSRFFLCGLFGAIAVASRPNGFIVIAAFGLIAAVRLLQASGRRLQELERLAYLTLMPIALAHIFAWYDRLFHDWFALFHSDSFVRPQTTPFPSLKFFGVGDEGEPYLFFFVLAGILELARRREWELVIICLGFYLPSLFLQYDITRYLLPIIPFAVFFAGERLFASIPVRVAGLLTIPLIYIYTWTTLLDPGYQAPFGPLRAILH